jgi:hypothetical protein
MKINNESQTRVQVKWKNIANGFQLVLHGIAKPKCIGHLQV